jgi:quercetin dioxygenase-like cupin family protein
VSESPFSELGEIAPQQIWDGVVVRAVHGDRTTLGLIELAPGSLVPEHSHENEQMGVLVSGAVRFRIGDETRDLGPGATWRIRANVPHEVEAGPEGAVVVELFTPWRSDWTALERLPVAPPPWPWR